MSKRLTVKYDRAGDVLYVVMGAVVPMEGDGLPGGVELDYAQSDGSPVGVTVIGYARNEWLGKIEELAAILSRHLSVDPANAKRALERANA